MSHVSDSDLELTSVDRPSLQVSSSRFEGPDFNWAQRRAREKEFVDTQPTVVVIGAGHIGLQVAARLQYLEVATLVLEKLPRVGDVVRINRSPSESPLTIH